MKKIIISLIILYREKISVHTAPSCRFIPTCSAYALEAVEKYGAGKGSVLAIRRLSKCHPFHRRNYPIYDPVP